MRPKNWRATYRLPFTERVEVTSYKMGTLLGPFGGGWTTKFGVLIGSSTVIVHAWRWEVRIEMRSTETNPTGTDPEDSS